LQAKRRALEEQERQRLILTGNQREESLLE
jgi:hypothetical protein